MATATFVRRSVGLLCYVALMIYTLFFAPGSLFDLSSVKTTLFGPEEARNPFFAALFSMLMPVAFGIFALLSAGASAQDSLSVEFFGALGSFLGIYGSGAYIALRNYAPHAARISNRLLFFEHWAAGAAILAYSIRVYISLLLRIRGMSAESTTAAIAGFAVLLRTDRYVFATAIDLVLLSIVGLDPLVEDMRRRGWRFDGEDRIRSALTAISIFAVPGAFLGLYVMIRPKLR